MKHNIEIGKCYFMEFSASSSNSWTIYVTETRGPHVYGWFKQKGEASSYRKQILGNCNRATILREAAKEEIDELQHHITHYLKQSFVIPVLKTEEYQIY